MHADGQQECTLKMILNIITNYLDNQFKTSLVVPQTIRMVIKMSTDVMMKKTMCTVDGHVNW